MNSIFKGIFVHRYRCVSVSAIIFINYYSSSINDITRVHINFLEMRLLRSELSALRRSVCGWSCTVTPFSMTAILSMWAGHYTTGWVSITSQTPQIYCEIICKINMMVMVSTEGGVCENVKVCVISCALTARRSPTQVSQSASDALHKPRPFPQTGTLH